MTPIFSALQQGYTPEEILKYLGKALPKLFGPITKATSSGYSAKQILGFLSKNFDVEDKTGMSESEIHAANNRADAERAKYGLTMAAGTIAAPLAARGIHSLLSRALPASVQTLSPGTVSQASMNIPSAQTQAPIPTNPQSQLPQQAGQIQNVSQQPPNLQNIPQSIAQPTQSQQPEVKNIRSDSDILWNALLQGKEGVDPNSKGFLKIAKRMQTTGEIGSKEDFDKFYKLFQDKQAQNLSLPKALKEASNEFTQAKLQPRAAKEALEGESAVDVQKRLGTGYGESAKLVDALKGKELEETKPIAKNETVATPHGVGEVIANRNGKAIVDVDGKKHQVNEDELIQSPLPEKDLADLYDEMIAGIEKETGQQVSRNVEWGGYSEKYNELVYKPHGGPIYVYDNISPEDAKILTSILVKRKSTGENNIGPWIKGSNSPIGAAMSALIARLQEERGGKGEEYIRKFETIYDAIEPSRTASKKRYAERKKAERKAKKSGLT